ncbi:MAG: hypothetical protein JNK85_30395 [Verrucomicrobiales bacterium]|nr:hypothetical protein [Verrucomicrobiales bacterium]
MGHRFLKLLAFVLITWFALPSGGGLATPTPTPVEFLPNSLFAVGTSTTDLRQRDWAYLLWIATDQELVLGRSFAVYAKSGDAAAPGEYTRRAVVGLQTEPAVIQSLLGRARVLGDDLSELEGRIDALFTTLRPPAGGLPEKISAMIRGALGDPSSLEHLALLGRVHPGINFCLGYAHAEPVGPGKTTFEIREFDLGQSRDLAVVGRVTVESGAPMVLPAPGPLVEVPERTARGDLNVRFRWATPTELRRLTLLNHGFNLYRVSRADAEARGFHTRPPSGAVLRQESQSGGLVHRVNALPILTSVDLDANEAVNLAADSRTVFAVDDNDRHRAGQAAWRNGDQFYYFVTARDVLGRDGQASAGLLVTICDRLPPDAPRGVRVENHYEYAGGSGRQALEVTWLQAGESTDRVVQYYVYRWDAPADILALGADPVAHRVGGPIAHVPGRERARFLDAGPGSPQSPAEDGTTYWYTVRAVDDGACNNGNWSAHSAAAFGVLRDRTGPEAPEGDVVVRCCGPTAVPFPVRDEVAKQSQVPALANFRFTCRRSHPAIASAEFYLRVPGISENLIAHARFSAGSDDVQVEWSIDRALVAVGSTPFYCRVGTSTGETSEFAVNATALAPKVNTVRVVPFGGDYPCDSVSLRAVDAGGVSNPRGCTGSHDPNPRPDLDLGDLVGPEIHLNLTPGTKEYRLYRRVDDGPLTLIRQGPADFEDASEIAIVDPDVPANAAVVCYFGQVLDEQGNASPLVPLSDCVPIRRPTGIPMLAPIEARGDIHGPRMRLRWFCPPYGVDRFQLSIADNLGAMAAEISADLSPMSGQAVKTYTLRGISRTNLCFFYRTPRVGPAFGNGAMFEVEVDAALGVSYDIMVAAVGVDGAVNQDSNVETFRWRPVSSEVGLQVPWPARDLPVQGVFSGGLRAFRLPDGLYPGIGLRLGVFAGAYLPAKTPIASRPTQLVGQMDPATLLYTNRSGSGPLPLAVYRVQVAGPEFPQVSGDLIQVTPLIESIAHEFTLENQVRVTVVHDPYVRVGPNVESPHLVGQEGALYLLDTQPVIVGARYVYLVVRFQSNGEILEVFPSNVVEVTP